MARKAKLTRKQAVRTAKKFSFEAKEDLDGQTLKTGDVELSRRPDSWKSFFALVKQTPVGQNFLSKRDRGDQKPQKRTLF